MANTTERIGVSYCSLIASKTEWMFREQPIDDIGIDAHMERTDKDGKVQQLLALQIKSGESYFKENKGEYVDRVMCIIDIFAVAEPIKHNLREGLTVANASARLWNTEYVMVKE